MRLFIYFHLQLMLNFNEFQEGTSWCAKGLKSAILYGNPALGTGHVHGPPGTAASKSISGVRAVKKNMVKRNYMCQNTC